jgi:hypothetical protein
MKFNIETDKEILPNNICSYSSSGIHQTEIIGVEIDNIGKLIVSFSLNGELNFFDYSKGIQALNKIYTIFVNSNLVHGIFIESS